MDKNKSLLFLALYYFSFTIPQYIQGLFVVYDRVSVQIVFISLLNLIVFLSFRKDFDLDIFIRKFRYKKHLLAYFLVILLSSISLFVADNLTEGIITLTKLISLFIAFILIVLVVFNSEINFIKYFFYLCIVSIAIETFVINYVTIDSTINDGNLLDKATRESGLSGNINISSFSIAIKLPVILYLIYMIKSNYKLILILLVLSSSILSILLLSSRAAIIAVILVLVSSLIYFSIKEKTKSVLKSFFIILSITISSFCYNLINEKNNFNILEDRFSSFNDPVQDDSISERMGFYKIAIDDIKSSPFFGVGIGNWKITSILRANEFLFGYRIPYFVHNDFLEVTAESGIISGLSYLYFLTFPVLILFIRIINKKNNNLSFIPFICLAVFIIDSLLNFPMNRVISMINLFFTITLFYIVEKNKNYKSEKFF